MFELLGFTSAFLVRGRASIADQFPPEKRCGIYVLHFTDGNFYVGQAMDVVRRYAQHRVTYADIEKMSFKPIPRDNLDDEERYVIGVLETEGYSLRNITFASMPKGDSDFDLIMPLEDQERWLRDLQWVDLDGSRLTNADLRQRYRSKFDRFVGMPHAARVMEVLCDYVRFGIPAIRRGEVSFWACSCLPVFVTPLDFVYSRININWQEVLTAYSDGNEPQFSVHLARSPVEQAFDQSLRRLRRRYPNVEQGDIEYVPGGSDQIHFIMDAVTLQAMIRDPQILPAIRLFNLRLMKKGPCTFGRYHCLDLADRLIE